jgi:hypothetical protein
VFREQATVISGWEILRIISSVLQHLAANRILVKSSVATSRDRRDITMASHPRDHHKNRFPGREDPHGRERE